MLDFMIDLGFSKPFRNSKIYEKKLDDCSFHFYFTENKNREGVLEYYDVESSMKIDSSDYYVSEMHFAFTSKPETLIDKVKNLIEIYGKFTKK